MDQLELTLLGIGRQCLTCNVYLPLFLGFHGPVRLPIKQAGFVLFIASNDKVFRFCRGRGSTRGEAKFGYQLASRKLCDLRLVGMVRIENGYLVWSSEADCSAPTFLNNSRAADFSFCIDIHAHSASMETIEHKEKMRVGREKQTS